MTEQQADYAAQETKDGLDMFWQDKPRQLPSILSGFTPAPDVLIKKHGYVTALVWGKIWRYCQMADGVCRAKLERIADELGMSERTIMRHADVLCGGDFLLDTTPDLKNRPHIYADTGKIRIKISIEATMTESHSTVTESHRQGDTESVEESKKKQVKKVKIKEGASASPKTPKATEIPEIVLFRSVTGRYPSKDTFRVVAESIQKVSARLGYDASSADLLPFWEAWRIKGFKSVNLSWLTDWAVSGKITNGNSKAPAPSEPKAFDGIRKFLSRHQGEPNG